MRSSIILIALAARLAAQDAGTALSQMVQARSMRNSSKLPAEQLSVVDRLLAAASKASQTQSYSEAVKEYQHAMALLRNDSWTPEKAWALALTMKPEHSVVDPGQTFMVKVGQRFALDQPVAVHPFAFVNLLPAEGEQPRVLMKTFDHLAPDFTDKPLAFTVTIPNTGNGLYRISIDFEKVATKTAPIAVARGVMAGVAKAKLRVAKIDAKKAPELPSAEGHLARIEAADRGEFGDNIRRLDFNFELREANRLLDDLAIGKDPFASQYGDIQKAYRSAVDNTLQPYRLYVPSSYNGRKPYPLIVLLHGMGGDENSMFDSYGNGAFARLAEKRGYIVACSKGREPASMYRGPAERDVLDVLADVRRAYKVDPGRIYLTGHSMGAYGTWSIAMDHPEVFAALAPISGGGDAAQVAKIAKIPQLVVHGDADGTVSVNESRKMVEALKQAGAEVKYMEIAGGSHTGVAVPAFEPIFDWFDSHHK
jgi:predicted esterase